MGLFNKKEEPVKEPEKTVSEEFETVKVNLTDKMLRVELIDESAYLHHGEIGSDENHIIIKHGGILVAEIGARSKAYKELEPYIGRSVDSIAIKVKTGDYGDYYQVQMKFKYMVVTTG